MVMSDKRFGMLIDLSLCIGCNACAVACKEENDVPLTCFNTWVESFDVQDAEGRVRRANVPKLCNHCENPACVEVCPADATYAAEDGTVLVDVEKCIGCGACVQACPYGARYINPELNVAGKCTFCHHRSENGLLPACVATCVSNARIFGDLNDPDSDISKRLAEVDTEVLLPDTGLNPCVYYVGLDKTMAMPKRSAVHKGGNVLEPYAGFQGAADGEAKAASSTKDSK
ncbi:MAG: 4Fe-4S dicluster domain-containing protein [Coriobacteriia bacterium]|nr:4Fe-4S dicluster domain-containing protein [Coriobacteriia bacterium]